MGSGFEIKWDKNALDRVVKETANKAVVEQGRKLQSELDSVLAQSSGKTAAEIKPLVQNAFRRIGGSISDPELTQYAEVIAEGTRIVVQPERLK